MFGSHSRSEGGPRCWRRSLGSMHWVWRRNQKRERARLAAHLRDAPKLDIAFDYFDAMFFFADYIGSFLLFLYACCGPEGPVDRRLTYLLALVMCALYSIRESLEFFKRLDEDNEAHECVYYFPRIYLLSLAAMFFLSVFTALYLLNFKTAPGETVSWAAVSVSICLIVLYCPGATLRLHFFVRSLEGNTQGLISRFNSLRLRMGDMLVHSEMVRRAGAAGSLPPRPDGTDASRDPGAAPFSHVTDERQNPALFLSLWDNVILPEIQGLIREDGVGCADAGTVRDRIFAAYLDFNSYCRAAYFQDDEALLDRHQIAACMTYAVLVAEPLDVDSADVGEYSYYANERLAFTLGCSVLVSFLSQYYVDRLEMDELGGVERSGLEDALAALQAGGIAVPQMVPNEDSYPMTLYRCLRFTVAEGSFNLLSLASLYYLLENATVGKQLYKDMRFYYGARG